MLLLALSMSLSVPLFTISSPRRRAEGACLAQSMKSQWTARVPRGMFVCGMLVAVPSLLGSGVHCGKACHLVVERLLFRTRSSGESSFNGKDDLCTDASILMNAAE